MENPDIQDHEDQPATTCTRRTAISLIAALAGTLVLPDSLLAKPRHDAEPYIGAEVIENTRPYTMVLPSATRDEIFRTFVNLPGSKEEIATSPISYHERFPHLYTNGRAVHVGITAPHVRRKLPRFQAEWEYQRNRAFYSTSNIHIDTQNGAAIYVMNHAAFIDSEDPLIQNVARQITAGIEDPEDQLQAILYFVQQFPYQEDGGDVEIPAFPQASLARRMMDCEDKVILAISLAASIPSVKALGLAIVYARMEAQNEWHVLLGVGGRREKYKISFMPEPKQHKDWYLVDTVMPGSYPGYLIQDLEESAIRHVQPI